MCADLSEAIILEKECPQQESKKSKGVTATSQLREHKKGQGFDHAVFTFLTPMDTPELQFA